MLSTERHSPHRKGWGLYLPAQGRTLQGVTRGLCAKGGVRLRGTAGNAQAPRPKAAGSHWPLGFEGRGEAGRSQCHSASATVPGGQEQPEL